MNIRITPSHIARARNVVGLTAEEIAHLVESETSTTIGIFPTNLIEEPWRAHHLSGGAVDDVSEGVAIFRFENSTASFDVKQVLRRRELEKGKRGGRNDGSLFDLRNDSAESIAVGIAGNVSPHKAEAILKSLQAQVQLKRQKHAG